MHDRILIVDDETDILNLIKTILERQGFHVLTAVDGEEALLKAEAEIPDLVLLDLVLPSVSGLEVCRIIKSKAKTKLMPVVMLTTLGRDVDRKLTADAGADGHLTKPFTSHDLITEVTRHLEETRREKFSRQLGIAHEKLKGRKILLEFDPSTPYEKLVRDFVMESVAHAETVVVLTRGGSAIRKVVEGERGVELIDVQPDLMFSPLLDKHREGPLSIVYDSLTDLVLLTDAQSAYKFVQNSMTLLSDPRITVLSLFNPTAHEQRDVYSLRGLFSNQVVYGKEGISILRMA